jgi:hypothetical protein
MGNAAPPIKRRREEPHCACNVRFIPARVVPHSGQAYHALSALACASRLVVLRARGWVAKGDVFDDIS